MNVTHTRAALLAATSHRAIKKQLYAAPLQSRDRRRVARRNEIFVIQERDRSRHRRMYCKHARTHARTHACTHPRPSVRPFVRPRAHQLRDALRLIVVVFGGARAVLRLVSRPSR